MASSRLFYTLESSPFQGPCLSEIDTSPTSPTPGDIYLISGTVDSTLTGHENQVVYYDDNLNQIFITPTTGMFTYVIDQAKLKKFNGTAWENYAAEVNDSIFKYWDDYANTITTTSTSWQTYKTWTVNIPQTDNYLIDWQVLWSTNKDKTRIEIKFLIDGIEIELFKDATKESVYKSSYRGEHIQQLSAGNHTFEIQFRRQHANNSVTMYKAKLRLEGGK